MNSRAVRNGLRVAMTLAIAVVLVWAMQGALEDLRDEGTAENLKVLVIAVAASIIIALWLPFRPIRILAAALLLVVFGLAGIAMLLVLAGGPDSRGPPAGAPKAVLIALIVLCLPIVAFIACERQLAETDRRP